MTPLPGFVGRDKLPPEISWCPIRSQGRRGALGGSKRLWKTGGAGLGVWVGSRVAEWGLYATVRMWRYFIPVSLYEKWRFFGYVMLFTVWGWCGEVCGSSVLQNRFLWSVSSTCRAFVCFMKLFYRSSVLSCQSSSLGKKHCAADNSGMFMFVSISGWVEASASSNIAFKGRKTNKQIHISWYNTWFQW